MHLCHIDVHMLKMLFAIHIYTFIHISLFICVSEPTRVHV